MADPIDLCTLEGVKAAISFVTATALDDALLTDLITVASRRIMRRTRRELTPKTDNTARQFEVRAPGNGKDIIVDLTPYDLRVADLVELHPEATPVVLSATTHYLLRPVGGHDGTGTYTRMILAQDVSLVSDRAARFGGRALLRITGDWGAWATSEVADDVRRAAEETVVSWLDRAAGEYQTGITDDFGRAIEPARQGTWDIPASAWRKLQDFERMVVA